MTRTRGARTAFADLAQDVLGVFAFAFIVVVTGAHAAGSQGLSELAAGDCPGAQLCLLRGRLPACGPSADNSETEGSTTMCGPCLPYYHQFGRKCLTETELKLGKSLLNIILKNKKAQSEEKSQSTRSQSSYSNKSVMTSVLKLTTRQNDLGYRSAPPPLRSTAAAVAATGRHAFKDEQLADRHSLPSSQTTASYTAESQHLLATDSSARDVAASSLNTAVSNLAAQQTTSAAPLVRVQQQPLQAAAVMSAERMLMGRHESVMHVEAGVHEGAVAAATAGNRASGVDGLGKLSHLLFFVLVLSACLLTAVLLTAASVVWYRLRQRSVHLRKNRACEETERQQSSERRSLTSRFLWPRNSETHMTTRADPERKHRRALTVAVGDGKLAQSALRYHYERSKLQMLSSSSLSSLQHDRSTTSDNNDSSDEDNEALSGFQDAMARANTPDEEYTVYECPGLAPTSELEVHNPLFETKCHRSSSGGSNVGQS